jgi:hypothetical protein
MTRVDPEEMQSEVDHNEVKIKCLDPDEVKMDPDCMGPPDEVRVIV